MDIYWSSTVLGQHNKLSSTSMLSVEPESLFDYFNNSLVENNKNFKDYIRCPAAQQELKKTYIIKAAYDVDFFTNIDEKLTHFNSKNFTDPQMEDFVTNTYISLSENSSMFNVFTNLYLFSEENITVSSIHPYMHKNNYIDTQEN